MKKRRAIGFLNHPFSVRDMAAYAKDAERNGLESVWIADESFMRDPIPILSAIAVSTRTIGIATGVINPYTRNPMLIAQSLATLDEASGGRVILGIGAGEPEMERVGIIRSEPLNMIRESVHVINELLSGRELSFSGKSLHFDHAKLGRATPGYRMIGEFHPPRRKVPIYVAAIGPKMLRLAGEIADGVLLTAGCPPGGIRFAIENVKEGAQKHQRNYEQVDLATYILTCTTEKKTDENIVRAIVLGFLSSEHWKMYAAAGESIVNSRKIEELRKDVQKHGVEATIPSVTPDIVREYAAVGSGDDCLAMIQRYVDAGVKLPIILPIGSNIKELVSSLSLSS